ncbi:uncharacterized protein [Fopius arisanus]|uniref:Uncharacterized protein n=1 Tax=Fopius arisanus TaxID=64838 RepID=A0A9R1U8Y2_9HYME|nr:PREDICTED: uncharacterized protein LOC105272359 [Fopius arisanus]
MQPSMTFTPRVIHPFPQVGQTLVPISCCSRRFRRILPKLDPNVPRNPDLPTPEPSAVQTPYIVIIPRVDNPKPSIPNNLKLPGVCKRKPVLRITINKMYNGEETEIPERNGVRDLQEAVDVEPRAEQVEIRNYKLNRSVVFSLDPTTGEILVTKRAIQDSEDYSEDRIHRIRDVESLKNTEELINTCTDTGGECHVLNQDLDVRDIKREL